MKPFLRRIYLHKNPVNFGIDRKTRITVPFPGRHPYFLDQPMSSKWIYYLRSMFTLLAGVRNRGVLLRLLAGAGGRPAIVELRDGCRFSVRSFMDLWIIKETCLDRDYERDLPAWGEDWSCIDIGAGLGDFAVCAAVNHPGRRAAAFEPFRESYELLLENIRLNGVANVQAFPLAVAAAAGPLHLQTGTGVAVQHSTATASGSDPVVEGITLEEAVRRSGFEHCDLLKVDCEGGEYDIFFGASDAVLRKIDRIVMEYHDECTPHSHADLADFLRARGFSVRLRPNPVHRRLGFLTAVRNS
jgi:FkbM family methyltransferase